MDVDGANQVKVSAAEHGAYRFSWSPIENKLAFVSTNDIRDAAAYVVNDDGTGHIALTGGGAGLNGPIWSPDGSKIAFDSDVALYNHQIVVVGSDGSGKTTITPSGTTNSIGDWSPDSERLIFTSNQLGKTTYVNGNPRDVYSLFSIRADGTDSITLFDLDWHDEGSDHRWSGSND